MVLFQKIMNFYDICELVFKWCNAENEEDANKIFEITILGNISGDFVKAILKINNIVNELEKVAEIIENVNYYQHYKIYIK